MTRTYDRIPKEPRLQYVWKRGTKEWYPRSGETMLNLANERATCRDHGPTRSGLDPLA